ncbi:MAG: hypothetical protein RJB66_2517 [Pseudomonadota bacterium]|jgi:hypothetical protein
MERRNFLKIGFSSLFTYGLTPKGFFDVASADSLVPIDATNPNPIQQLSWNQLSSMDFNGDDIERTHEALWNREGYLQKRGGIPSVSETVETVIVGGGLSGLMAGYLLRDQQPLILEQASNFGGNSRGEQFSGQGPFSIGAAYITKPEKGSALEDLLTDIGILNYARAERADEAKVFFKNQFLEDFWKGSSDSNARFQFQQVFEKLQKIYNEKYPEIPWAEGGMAADEYYALDQISFADWLQQNFGALHPHVVEYFQLYCWSSFGGSIDELSAIQALNFLSAETDEIMAFPGGNAAVSQALFHRLESMLGKQRLRAGCLVLDVTLENDGVRVCYETPERVLRTIKARRCIFSAPKFVARKIITNMDAQQQKACEAITYRAYIVANIFVDTKRMKIKGKSFSPCFDLYCLDGEVPPTPSALRPPSRPFSDICFGQWAHGDQGDIGVLTVYKPFPFDGARQFLFNPISHSKYRSSITSAVRPLLEKLGLRENEILGVRLTRWGHSLPLAERGLLTRKTLAMASAPISDRIFFANQDNWASPSFESAFEAALRSVENIRS